MAEPLRLPGSGAYEQPIVGEASYQAALEDLCGGRTDHGHQKVAEAELGLEDDNPHDNHAVRVAIEGRTVGYLNREDARRYRARLREAGLDAPVATCAAVIVGGWDRGGGDRGHFGVRLDIDLDGADFLAPTPSAESGIRGYYTLLEAMRAAREGGDDRRVLQLVRESLELLPDLVTGTVREFGAFDLRAIPAIDEGALQLAIAGDRKTVDGLRRLLTEHPELSPWRDRVEEAVAAGALAERILDVVTTRPGIGQRELPRLLGDATKERVREVCYWLARLGRLRREPEGRSYTLWPRSSPDDAPGRVPQERSRRTVRRRTGPATPSRTRGRVLLLAIVVEALAVWVIIWLSRQP